MSSHQYRTRLPAPLEARLLELCAAAQLSYSHILRSALAYVLDHPEALEEVLTTCDEITYVDERTPSQVESWQRHYGELTSPHHVNQLLADHQRHMPQ